MSENCPNKATFLYSWNGELIQGCLEHATLMKTIANTMGIPMDIKKIVSDEDILCEHKDESKEDE